ncbi:helicase associated domain-containing protein [Streptomyces lavendulae]|uniref:helicase associated domain-containing protein n=1 Tax=Streptomyces lavendulae TaxID=1914 RepID=UPI0036B2BCED
MQPSPLIGKAPADGEDEDENRLLLRFAAPRDPTLIAKWISYQVSNTERQDWRRGIEAAFRYREREGDSQVPHEHAEGPYALGRRHSGQRRTFRAGTLTGERAAELKEARDHLGHRRPRLRPEPRRRTRLPPPARPPGRRPGGLGKDPVRAGRRAAGSGRRAAGSGQRAAGSGQRAAGSGQRAAGSGTLATSPSSWTKAANQKQRRDRLDTAQLAGLEVQWAR